MRQLMVVAWAVVAAGCLAPVVEGRLDGGPNGGGAGGGASAGGAGGSTGSGGGGTARACALDNECPPGELCEECNGVKSCISGCSASKPCPPQTVCRALGVACLTCPCPTSECVNASNCVDVDGDGFVPGSGCALPGGDCDPGDPRVFPGATEDCNNGRDDDCNGRVDLGDVACQSKTCSDGPCASTWDCGIGRSTCGVSPSQPACCAMCPDIAPPLCTPNARIANLGPDPFTGCMRFGCVPVGTTPCPTIFAPVCAASSAGGLTTFDNLCEAQAVGASLLHTGACLTGEGLSCDIFPSPGGIKPPGCGPTGTLYCRDTCPTCDDSVLRCTKVGTCVLDLDCPAGLPPPIPASCPATAPWRVRCEANACVGRCG